MYTTNGNDWKVESQFSTTNHFGFDYVVSYRFVLCFFFKFLIVQFIGICIFFRSTSVLFSDKKFKSCFQYIPSENQDHVPKNYKTNIILENSGAYKIDYKSRCIAILCACILCVCFFISNNFIVHGHRQSKRRMFSWLILASYDRLAHFSMSHFFTLWFFFLLSCFYLSHCQMIFTFVLHIIDVFFLFSLFFYIWKKHMKNANNWKKKHTNLDICMQWHTVIVMHMKYTHKKLFVFVLSYFITVSVCVHSARQCDWSKSFPLHLSFVCLFLPKMKTFSPKKKNKKIKTTTVSITSTHSVKNTHTHTYIYCL